MAVDDEDIVRRRDEQRLAEQTRRAFVEMGGDGFPAPGAGQPAPVRLLPLERERGVPTPSSGVYQEMEA